MRHTKKLVQTALYIAVGLVLPPIVRMIPNAGVYISPMHIPVLLAGLTIGPLSGFLTGMICPVLNNILYGMPMGNTLIGMCVELPVYGLVTGWMIRGLGNVVKNRMALVYLSLAVAMIAGRIAGGLMQGVVLGTEGYGLSVWAASYFVSTAPGILIQLILIPSVYAALYRAHLIGQ